MHEDGQVCCHGGVPLGAEQGLVVGDGRPCLGGVVFRAGKAARNDIQAVYMVVGLLGIGGGQVVPLLGGLPGEQLDIKQIHALLFPGGQAACDLSE